MTDRCSLGGGYIARLVRGQALVLACVLLACVTVSAGAATVPEEFYGVNSGHTLVNDAATRPAALQAMRAGGLSFVRVDASWGAIEPVAPVAGVHTYVWAKYDLFVADLARSGLRWYPMLGYSTPWASSTARDPFAPPSGDGDFAAFAAAFAARYGSGGSFWAEHPELPWLPTTVYGIWNEPSNDRFWRGADATPARYMGLYVAARAAIRSVDREARVATAGLLDSGVVDGNAYLRAMLDSAPAARNQIDAVGWHPYVGGDADQILASILRARTALDDYGLGDVPIEISEVGWLSAFAPAQRAEWLRDLAVNLPHAGMNVTRLLPYVWTGDAEWQITNLDGSLGQTGEAYFAGIREALLIQPATTSRNTAARSCIRPATVQRLRFSATRYPTIKKHTRVAVAKGWPRILVLNRPGARERRERLLGKVPTRPRYDRGEYPPAVGRGRASAAGVPRGLVRGTHPRGWMADVTHVPSRENRSHRSALAAKLRGLCNGTRFRYVFE